MKFRLAPVFGDGMVVQRNQPVRIYGEAEEALRLQVDFDGVHAAPAVSKGRFAFLLPPRRAGTGLTLRIAGGGEKLTIRDIACGEVWIAGGQSNMAMDLSGTAEYTQGSSSAVPDTLARESRPSSQPFIYAWYSASSSASGRLSGGKSANRAIAGFSSIARRGSQLNMLEPPTLQLITPTGTFKASWSFRAKWYPTAEKWGAESGPQRSQPLSAA